MANKKNIISFQEAKAAVKVLGISTPKEYEEAFKNNKYLHSNLPWRPAYGYSEEWKGWGDFLGNGRGFRNDFAEYEVALELVRKNKIESKRKYLLFAKKCNINIPLSPESVYKDKWTGWNNFLGTDNGVFGSNNQPRLDIISYCEMKDLIEKELKPKYGVTGVREYNKFTNTEDFKKYERLPKDLRVYYKRDGFISFKDLLGKLTYYTYSELKDILYKNEIYNMDLFIEFCCNNKDEKIPDDVEKVYTSIGVWKGWDDLFSNKNVQLSIDYDKLSDKALEESIESEYQTKTAVEWNPLESVDKSDDLINPDNDPAENTNSYAGNDEDKKLNDLIDKFDMAYMNLKSYLISIKK